MRALERRIAAGLLSTAALLMPSLAAAEEPVAAGEPRLLKETGEITSVVDAFDDDDPFDLHLYLGFQQRWKSANIRRETNLNQPGLSTGGFVSRNENVASYSQSVSILNMGADVGLYKDLALVFRLPIILSDSRELTELDGSAANSQRLLDPTGASLFSVPFKSPTRSGIDYFSLGLNYAIFNQQRDPSKPTWVFGVEGRFGIGAPLRACRDVALPGGVKCPVPGKPGVEGEGPGISRATTAIRAHTTFSRRVGYVEPYAGVEALVEIPQDRSAFGQSKTALALLNRPPIQGILTVGMEVIPWEQRESFQRLVFDARVRGTYFSPGREYTELFDALGTSTAPSLTRGNPAAYTAGPLGASVADPAAGQVFFYGVTDQHPHGSLGLLGQVTYQVAEYVKFNAGLGYTRVQAHMLSTADNCNPDFGKDPSKAGPCTTADRAVDVTGVPNPAHRSVIDLPGRRFSADDTTIVDLWLNGVVMF